LASFLTRVIFSGSTAKDLKVHIGGCSGNDAACIFARSQKATISANFTSPKAFRSAKIKLSALGIDFPLKPADACGTWGLKCPSSAGARQTLNVEVVVEETYPKIDVNAEFGLVADTGDNLICKSFPVKIN
jgi:hypothetical protein